MSKLDEIVYCDLSCGSNGDPADGFGGCTCGQETKRNEIKKLMLEVIGEDEDCPTGNEIVEQSLNMTQMYRIDAQNELRGQLREKVEEL